MTEATDTEINPLAQAAGRRRRLLLIIAAGALAIATATIWFVIAMVGSNSDAGSGHLPSTETVTDLSLWPERRYSDEELGIDRMIVEHLTPVWTHFRSLSDWDAHLTERNRYLDHEATGHERERLYFERNVAWLLSNKYEELPANLGRGGTLDQAFEEAMDRCAHAQGWPDVQLYGVSNTDVEQYEADLGLSLNQFLDVRHECTKVAATYPTLDPAVRDELLGELKEHYRAAVHEYLREFPDAEVPLVDHLGAPRPLEERLIEICLKTPDPAQCAAEFRVELPAG